jgi:hypothetical protein
MGTLKWTESSSEENTGVDHLGMRVADESSYSQLIDFTTTVTWRPRYYSFLCWAAQRAFLQNGGDFNHQSSKVNFKGYQKTIKRMEYGLVAASLVHDSSASKVAGTDKVSIALESLKKTNSTTLPLQGNHLKASAGGLSIYAGVMRTLGLLSSSEGFDVPLPGSTGDALAKAFARCLDLTGLDNPLDQESLDLTALEKIGSLCALHGLNEQALGCEAVNDELGLIRKVIIDWDNFRAGTGSSARRILSLGLILESRKLYPEQVASLALFREFTLLGGARISNTIVPLNLPSIYSPILLEWKMYQVHAYITFALESVLALTLVQADEMQEVRGDRILQADLTTLILEHIPHSWKESSPGRIPKTLDRWWDQRLIDLVTTLESIVNEDRNFPLCEPELFVSVSKLANPKGSAKMATWVHDTYLMLLLSLVRMRSLLKTYGEKAWIGTDQSFRLTPDALNNHLNKALTENLTVLEYAKRLTSELAIKQHHQNALRKLISQPDKDTAKFLLEGPYFIPVGTHKPGTSSPRYENALLFLQGLGLLTSGTKPEVTSEGEAVLMKIRGVA